MALRLWRHSSHSLGRTKRPLYLVGFVAEVSKGREFLILKEN